MDMQKLPPEMQLLKEKEAAEIIGKKVATLRSDRIRGTGIPFVKMGHLVRYRLSDISAYIEENVKQHTSRL